MLTVYGAGSVGLVVGARLARAAGEVLIVTRRPDPAHLIASRGVRFEDPGSGETWTARPAAVAGIDAAADQVGDGPVLFCMRTSETEASADALSRVAGAACVVSMQNDVVNEALLARRFPRVLGAVLRQSCTRTAPNAAVALGPGRVILGAYPQGGGSDVESLAERFRAAGYDVGVSRRIVEDLWLKLLINLMSAPNALIRRPDHATRTFVEVKARLIEEAKAVIEAAGITARSCDGRDRSVSEEIRHQRQSLARGTSARSLPVYNQVWTALRHGQPPEADRYHRRILDLAAEHGLRAPLNERVLGALERAVRDSLGPESMSAEELLGEP